MNIGHKAKTSNYMVQLIEHKFSSRKPVSFPSGAEYHIDECGSSLLEC